MLRIVLTEMKSHEPGRTWAMPVLFRGSAAYRSGKFGARPFGTIWYTRGQSRSDQLQFSVAKAEGCYTRGLEGSAAPTTPRRRKGRVYIHDDSNAAQRRNAAAISASGQKPTVRCLIARRNFERTVTISRQTVPISS
jgi:hypothetical protein